MKRDPRVDPKPGDVLRKGESTVDVSLVESLGFGFSFLGFGFSFRGQAKDMPPMPNWDKPWRPAWRLWAKDAEVLVTAE